MDAYKILEAAAVSVTSQLEGCNTEQWLVRVSIEDAQGRTIEQALRILFDPKDTISQ